MAKEGSIPSVSVGWHPICPIMTQLTNIIVYETQQEIEQALEQMGVEDAEVFQIDPEVLDPNIVAIAIRFEREDGVVGRDVLFDCRWDHAKISQKVWTAAAAIWRETTYGY